MPLERSDVGKALSRKGFREATRNRDHDFYFLHVDGKKTSIFTKLSRGSDYRTLGDPLVKKIADQLKLTKVQLANFVECSLTETEYLALLRARGINLR